MEADKGPKPPIAGIIYGEIAYWLIVVGLVVAVAGSAVYFATPGYVDKEILLERLWDGAEAETIWEEATTDGKVPHGHWYLGKLGYGDAIAMLGIAIAGVAAVVGMWGVFVSMARNKVKIYAGFTLVVAVILTLSALGLISLEH